VRGDGEVLVSIEQIAAVVIIAAIVWIVMSRIR
jgi:hypothetical protein